MHKIILFVILISFVSCKPKRHDVIPENKTSQEESLIEVNKMLVQKETEIIESYIKRRNWEMIKHDSGFWYSIDSVTEGKSPKTSDKILYNYKLWLLDGTLCSETPENKPKTITIGQSEIESGLNTGLQIMKVGEKAKFIIPPHLAHGLLGDNDKIPPRSIILYEIELIEILDK